MISHPLGKIKKMGRDTVITETRGNKMKNQEEEWECYKSIMNATEKIQKVFQISYTNATGITVLGTSA